MAVAVWNDLGIISEFQTCERDVGISSNSGQALHWWFVHQVTIAADDAM
jgi:hypothetical protein